MLIREAFMQPGLDEILELYQEKMNTRKRWPFYVINMTTHLEMGKYGHTKVTHR